jgi:hypothetical protein
MPVVEPARAKTDALSMHQDRMLRMQAGIYYESPLDDDHDNGTVDDATYQQRRRAYKEQLCMLVEQWPSTEVSHKAIDGRRAEV